MNKISFLVYHNKYFNVIDLMQILIKIKKNKDGLWNLNASYPGQVHLKMETAGNPSRWNTLRILRIKRKYDLDL